MGDINKYSPESGRYIDESGRVRNFVDELLEAGSTAQPVGESKVNITQYAPRSGRFIAEDGSIYNLADLMGGGSDSYTKTESDARYLLKSEVDIYDGREF